MADVTPEERAYWVGLCRKFPVTCSCANRCKRVVSALREAENAALERAAETAEKYGRKSFHNYAPMNIAAAIRALKR